MQQQSPMLEAQSFNDVIDVSSFSPIFLGATTNDTTVIDLTSAMDDFEALNSSTAAGRKRAIHHTSENINMNENKRNRQNEHQMRPYNESQKNVPLKKRGVSNKSGLNFLNICASNEDSNQAQDLKIEPSSSNCDSTSTRNCHITEPKNSAGSSASSSCSSICNCYECFPTLGGKNGIRPKCKKNKKQDESTPSTPIEPKIDISMIPGPSGIQKKPTNSVPVKKRTNYYESDDDYDSDENNPQSSTLSLPPNTMSETRDVKAATLEAPHLQLDWLSDASSQESVTDDDVIFVSDRAEPIDLTADSDSENDARLQILRFPGPSDETPVDEANGDVPISNMRATSWPPHNLIEAPRLSHSNAPTSNTSSSRAPIMSSVALPNPAQVIISMNPRRTTPVPPRTINFREVITGNDVMLFGGEPVNYPIQQQSRTPSAATFDPTIEAPRVVTAENPNRFMDSRHSHNYHHNSHNHHGNSSGTNSNVAHSNNHAHSHHHHRRYHHLQNNNGVMPQNTPTTENGANMSAQQQVDSKILFL